MQHLFSAWQVVDAKVALKFMIHLVSSLLGFVIHLEVYDTTCRQLSREEGREGKQLGEDPTPVSG